MLIGRPKGVKNKQYTYEFKLKVIKDYLENHLTTDECINKYSISRGTFICWKKLYEEGLLETGKRNKYAILYKSAQLTTKENIELENIKSKIESERLKISSANKKKWRKQGVRFYLELEYGIILELSKEYPVSFLCELMNINKSGYYKWLKRGPNKYELNRMNLTAFIKEVHEDYPSYGYHGIASEVRKKSDLVFSDNLIHKICKYEGIKSKMKHYMHKKKDEEKVIYENMIKSDWSTSGPLQKVVSDMTVVPFKGKLYEWTYFLDVYNDSIICSHTSGKMGDPRPYFKCRDELISLIKREELPEPVIFHTDQGSVYSSLSFNQVLIDNNVIRSMSRAGTPTDNAVIESMNGWIKAQIKCDYNMDDYNSIEEFINNYVYYYNHERPMYKLNYKSPAKYTLEQGFKILF